MTSNLTQNSFTDKRHGHGKKFAPSYANIFMAAWEQKALASFRLKPLAYFR